MAKLLNAFCWLSFFLVSSFLFGCASSRQATIITKIGSLSQNDRPVRLGVFSFSSTSHKSQDGTSDKLGAYISERMISQLDGAGSKVRIFERARIDAVAQELALGQTGLIDGNKAIKIGEMLPVDYVLTGTYTPLKDIVEINMRVIDVRSGEIVTSSGENIALTEEIRSLLPKEKIQTETAGSGESGETEERPACISEFYEIRDLFNDYDKNKSTILKRTLNFPVDSKCMEAHSRIVYRYKKQMDYPKKYRTFLLHALEEHCYTYEGTRFGGDIIAYLRESPDGLSDEVWNSALVALEKTPSNLHHLLIRNIFTSKNITVSQSHIQEKRIDQYISLAQAGKLGKTSKLSPAKASQLVLGSLEFKTSDSLSHLSKKHIVSYVDLFDSSGIFDIVKRLKSMHGTWEKRPEKKKEIVELLCTIFNTLPVNTKTSDEMIALITSIDYKSYSTRHRPAESKMYRSHVALIFDRCKETINKLFPLCKDPDKRHTLYRIVSEYNQDIPGFYPALPDVRKQLLSDNTRIKTRAAEIVNYMGIKAAPLKAVIVRDLERSKRKSYMGRPTVQANYLLFLGKVGIKGNEEFTNVISFVETNSAYKEVTKAARKAFSKSGNTGVHFLLSRLAMAKDSKVKISLVKTLALVEGQEKNVLSELSALAKSTDDQYVKIAIEEILEGD